MTILRIALRLAALIITAGPAAAQDYGWQDPYYSDPNWGYDAPAWVDPAYDPFYATPFFGFANDPYAMPSYDPQFGYPATGGDIGGSGPLQNAIDDSWAAADARSAAVRDLL
jgi:hypothetical protein